MGVIYNYFNVIELAQLCFYAKCTRFIIIVLLSLLLLFYLLLILLLLPLSSKARATVLSVP